VEVEGKRLPASTVFILYAEPFKKAVFTFFVHEQEKCLVKYCTHAFPHFSSASLKEYEKCISWTVMFDRLSLVSLWNEKMLQ